MSAIAGYWDSGGDLPPATACELMLSALKPFGPDGSKQIELGNISIGLTARHLLPEDDLETQPLIGGEGRYLLALDGRIDNRVELADWLGVDFRSLAEMSDARLLLVAWERWQLRSFDHLLGDVAVVIWDAAERKLTLARSPLALRPVFYRRSAKFLAFASMPKGLLALPNISRLLDQEELAAIAAGGFYGSGPRTMFEGIRLVRPGEAIEFVNGCERSIRIWDLARVGRTKVRAAELGEALRAEFDRAVAAQLRRRGGVVACHLSAGRDSGAVTSTAALAMREAGEEVLALTGAPRAGFADGDGRGWLVDESMLAAELADAHDNIRHLICRPDSLPPEPQLDELHRFHFGPLLNPSNQPWVTQINRTAAANGASLLLVGSVGNFSISAGGRDFLIDLMRERGAAACRELARFGGRSPVRWRSLLNQFIGPRLPRQLYRLVYGMSGRSITDFGSLPALLPPLRRRAEALRAERFRDWRPPRSYRQQVEETLLKLDNAERVAPVLWGLDLRDPTADRRLVELCLSFPAEAYWSTRSERPVFHAAFSDRLPASLLRNRPRGYQTADWFERFDPERIRQAFRRYGRNPLVREIVDQDQVERLLDHWPTSGGWRLPTIETYRNQLLGTLAIASFIDVHFSS